MPEESNEGSSEVDKLLAELENETLPEETHPSKSETIKDKQAAATLKKLKTTTESHEYDDEELENDMQW